MQLRKPLNDCGDGLLTVVTIAYFLLLKPQVQALCWLSRELLGSESWLVPAAGWGQRFQVAGAERVVNVCVCVCVCTCPRVYQRKQRFQKETVSRSASQGFPEFGILWTKKILDKREKDVD